MQQVVALFADWANGIFAVLIASTITHTDIVWWHFLVGIVCAHLPDIDALPELLRRGRVAASAEHTKDHRIFLHYPIIAFSIGSLAIITLGYWGWVLAIAIILHLVNDLYGTGWGVQLFWPLSRRSYKLFGRRVNRLAYMLRRDGDWDTLPVDEQRPRVVVSWSETELPSYIVRWGVDRWIPQWYYRLNWVSGIEYGLFVLACIVAYLALVT